jgi:hypothetical protein
MSHFTYITVKLHIIIDIAYYNNIYIREIDRVVVMRNCKFIDIKNGYKNVS